MSRQYQSSLISKKHVAEGTLEVAFRRPEDFQFRAGQYMQFAVPKLLYPDPEGSSRVMSIASSPLSQKEICVIFRDTGTGFKNTLKELPLGSPVIIEGPHGFFTLPERSPRPVVFIAGGIGLTPYLSMLQYATAAGLDLPITLLYFNRSKESAVYLKELHELAKSNASFTMHHKLGRIDEHFIQERISDFSACLWYMSGPPNMIAYVRNLLFHLGIEDSKILYEEFIGY